MKRDEWETVRLGDVFIRIKNGVSIKQGGVEGGYPITRIETISDGSINREKMGYAGITDLKKYEDYVMQDGDILMSHINSEKHLGKSAVYSKFTDEMIIHGMNLLLLRVNSAILNNKYAYYYFLSNRFKSQLSTITKKSVNQASFSIQPLKTLEIPLPPLDIQRQIADTLDKVTELITLRKTQLKKLDELVKARFVEMFGDPISNPMGWKTDYLKNVTNKIGSGATPKGGKESYQAEGITLIRSMNVHDGRFEYKDLAHITDEQAKQLENVTIEENDVFINITGASVARSCIVPKHILPARVNQHVAIIRCITSILNPVFANNMFLNHSFKGQLLDIGETGGATRQAITKQQLETLEVILPPIELQEQFAAFVEQTDKSKVIIQQSLDTLETLKKSLMQEYFE